MTAPLPMKGTAVPESDVTGVGHHKVSAIPSLKLMAQVEAVLLQVSHATILSASLLLAQIIVHVPSILVRGIRVSLIRGTLHSHYT